MHNILLVISVFVASIVEGVEALTIVLAMGTTRGWRSTWYGAIAAIVTLTVIVAVLGSALTLIPIGDLRLVVGALLLIFGLQWLRKAILRASGFKPLHDEATIFKKTADVSRSMKHNQKKAAIDDWYAFTIAFKGVLLEGLEIVFIVVTFGASQGSIALAVIAAIAAIIVVVVTGVKIQKPLSKVPENTLKFVVGIMLTSFGIFWSSEGVGTNWPGGDVAIIGLIIFIAVISFTQIVWLRHRHNNLSIKKGHSV